MRTIEVHRVITSRGDRFTDTDDPTEQPAEQSQLATINAECIRCFYPRKNNRPGTRITFMDGGGFAVTEDYEAVKAYLAVH